MKRWKLVASYVVAILGWLVAGKLLSFSCSATARTPTSDDALFIWLLPLMASIFLHMPIYDFISFVTYKLGYEQSFDDVEWIAEGGGSPASRRMRFIIGYPFIALVLGGFLLAWTNMVYCS